MVGQERQQPVDRHLGRQCLTAFDFVVPRLIEKLRPHLGFHRAGGVVENTNCWLFLSQNLFLERRRWIKILVPLAIILWCNPILP